MFRLLSSNHKRARTLREFSRKLRAQFILEHAIPAEADSFPRLSCSGQALFSFGRLPCLLPAFNFDICSFFKVIFFTRRFISLPNNCLSKEILFLWVCYICMAHFQKPKNRCWTQHTCCWWYCTTEIADGRSPLKITGLSGSLWCWRIVIYPVSCMKCQIGMTCRRQSSAPTSSRAEYPGKKSPFLSSDLPCHC